MEVTYKVHRKDPENGGESSYSTYKVDLPEDATVLEGLQKIRDEQDDTLAFRASCCQGYCGECAVRLNYSAKLTCATKIGAVTKKAPEIQCDPVRNIPVIKDLVFDMDAFLWDKIAAMKPWMEPDEEFAPTENVVPESEMAGVRKTMSCYQCGLCDEGCAVLPVDFNFLGPAALVKGYRFVMDPRETGAQMDARMKVVEQPKGLWGLRPLLRGQRQVPARPRSLQQDHGGARRRLQGGNHPREDGAASCELHQLGEADGLGSTSASWPWKPRG